MSLSGTLAKLITKKAADRFERATLNPMRTQLKKLLTLMKKNRATEYGRRYGFASIKSVSDYQSQVPVIKYEDIRDDIERVLAGARNILTAETPVMFAQTSGTTGSPKYIPVTPTCRSREHRDVSKTWAYHAMASHPGIKKGKIASLVSPAVEGYTECGIPFGSASGQIYRDMPSLVTRSCAVPCEVFEITDYQAKYYAVMRLAMEKNISLICTANPSSILKMCEKGNEFSEDIIRDIRDGALSRRFDIEPEIRGHLQKHLKPNSDKCSLLENARSKRKGLLIPADYWPNLCLIGCWKGGTVGHYLEKFPQWFSPDTDLRIPVRDWGYLSSEARGSIPITDKGSAGILTVATNFYEFVEVDDLMADPDNPSAWTFRTTEQLLDQKEYYIFITTTGGLYRYDINDIIRVEGYYNQTPQIVFVRKGRGMTNITGEKLSVNQIIDAIGHASEKTGAIASHFKAEADVENSRYVFRVEFIEHIGQEQGRAFLKSVDDYLKQINIEYKAKRDSMRLASPVLHVMREGWYEHGRRQLVESGQRAFQAKTQLLSTVKLKNIEIKPELEQVIEI